MNILTLPGLIDPHVHLRDLGQTHKEDFYTGTSAALAGGYTTIIDMPNNKIPITSYEALEEKIKIAKEKIVCDVGFYFGSVGDNLEEFRKVNPPAGGKVLGLKLYLNQTTGDFIVNKNLLEKMFFAWSKTNISSQSIVLHSAILSTNIKPVLVHAEGKIVEEVISVVKKIRVPTHFCHISTAVELKMIINAKEQGLQVTCGVTPHHLFLTQSDAKTLGSFGKMKPALRTKKDMQFLWTNINLIDVIESDHAPHTIGEKDREGWRARGTPIERPQATKLTRTSDGGKARQDPEAHKFPYGVPGLETTLPLLLTAVSEHRLTVEDIVRLCFKNPSRIFCSSRNCDAKVEVDLHKSYTIDNKNLFTKCHWSPFNGWKVKGKIQKVWIRGTKVFEDGKVLVKPGFGKIITPHRQ